MPIMGRPPQILACSGIIRPPEGLPPERLGAQIGQAMRLAEVARPRACYIATAVGDQRPYIDRWYERASRHGPADLTHLELFVQPNVPDVAAHLLKQDVIFVSGGSVVNLLAVWRVHRLDEILRDCWDRGVVLAGWSAGSLCWHSGGVTDSFGDSLTVLNDGLGFLPFSNGVHDDLPDQPRRARYRRAVADGLLPAGHATEDGVALHYVGTRLHRALAVLPDRRAWHVEPQRVTAVEPELWIP
ncbi:MAG TPA: peptidase E [Spirillospora sp.]|nr:peptidase E [Spirillospora sp.]